MAKNHDQLDAHHAARLELSRQLGRFQRRLYDEAQTAIAAALQAGEFGPGAEFASASDLGRELAERIANGYIGIDPQPVLEAGADQNSGA